MEVMKNWKWTDCTKGIAVKNRLMGNPGFANLHIICWSLVAFVNVSFSSVSHKILLLILLSLHIFHLLWAQDANFLKKEKHEWQKLSENVSSCFNFSKLFLKHGNECETLYSQEMWQPLKNIKQFVIFIEIIKI